MNKEFFGRYGPGGIRDQIHHLNSDKATSSDILNSLKSENDDLRAAASRSRKISPEHLEAALASDDYATRRAALASPNLTPEHINGVINRGKNLI